jgi:hypothetical protein
MNKDSIATKTNTEFIHQVDDSLLIVRFHGFLKFEEAAKDNLILIDTVRQKRVRRLLINQRDIKVLSKEMQSLIVDNAATMANSGLKKLAVVLPEDVFALAAVSKIHSQSKITGVTIQLFSSESDGVEWLRKS